MKQKYSSHYEENYHLKPSDFFPLGYDNYCKRNGIISADSVHTFKTFSSSNNPYLNEVEKRAFFLRDYIQPTSVIIASGIGFGIIFFTTALTTGLIIEGVEKVKGLLEIIK